MAKFKVTILQHALEQKVIEVEAESCDDAIDTVRDSDEFDNGDGFTFLYVPERWIEFSEEMETEDGKD